jgi:hypothetical protein
MEGEIRGHMHGGNRKWIRSFIRKSCLKNILGNVGTDGRMILKWALE